MALRHLLRSGGRAKQILISEVWRYARKGEPVCCRATDFVASFSTVRDSKPQRSLFENVWILKPIGAPVKLITRPLHSSVPLQSTVEIVIPNMGDSVSEGSVAMLLKQEGDIVKEDDIVAQIETDKVTIDVKYTSATAGKITQLLVAENDTVAVGQPVAKVEQGDVSEANAAAAPEETSSPDKQNEEKAPSPPKEPQKAQEAQQPEKKSRSDESSSAQTGKTQSAKPSDKPPPREADTASPPMPPSSFAKEKRPERRVKMSRLRLRVAERLKGAQNTYAMLTTFNEVDMTNLMDMRNTYKDVFLEKHNVKLGFMSAFVKAAASALIDVPAVNAVIDNDELVYRDYYDISIAVATQKGLVVPVLRNVDKASFADVEKNINLLGKKARDGTISIDDMAGGTFTISNGGVYGSMLSTPIINPPQSAILGMHNIQKRAMVVEGKVEPRPVMYIALTYDHRLIDGREGVTFLKRVKEIIEDPRRLLLLV